MFEFNNTLRDNKINQNNTKPNSEKNRKKTILHTIIYVVSMSAFGVFIYLMMKPENKDKPQTSTDPKPNLTVTENISTNKEKRNSSVQSRSVYYTKFLSVINDFETKTELTSDGKIIPRESYLKPLVQYAETFMGSEMMNLTSILSLVDAIKSTKSQIKNIKKETSLTLNTFNYYNALFIYYRILYLALNTISIPNKEYSSDNLQKSQQMITNKNFIYQQLILKEIIYCLSQINNYFEEIIQNILSTKENSEMKRMSTAIINQQEIIAKEMFVKFNGNIEFKFNGKEVKINYLINNVGYLKRFISLNMLLIFMHMFEVNIEYRITEFSTDANKVLKELLLPEEDDKEKDRSTIEKLNEVIKECKQVYVDLVADVNEKKIPHFLESFLKDNFSCLTTFNKVVQGK
eukprot:GAHX01003026.1.p1 GENE.GAHX01003026.1~~GAHX01003026.1.p1  ORF type:complete len:404 (+),score=87.03 GAHX01003026.1:284-1495(+)